MVVNLWNKISVWCACHNEPIEMKVFSNTELVKTPYYACSSAISNTNSFTSESSCPNRINMDDYQGLVLKFLDIVSEKGLNTDYTNFSYIYKGTRQKIFVRVMEYSDDSIKLEIKNMTVLGIKK